MAMEKYIDILSAAIPNWNVNENLRSKVRSVLDPLSPFISNTKNCRIKYTFK